jgi:hypothetical protein
VLEESHKMDEEKSVSPRSSEPAKTGKEMCSCGHRANKHAAFKYACQAPGGYKGFCPCMVFIPKGQGGGKKQFPRLMPSAKK